MTDIFLDDYTLENGFYNCVLSNDSKVSVPQSKVQSLMDKHKLTEIDAVETYLWDNDLLHDSETENTPKVKIRGDSAKPRKKTVKERKIDNEKLEILSIIADVLNENGYNAEIEKEIAIHFGDFSLKLTRHRTKK